MVVLGEGLDEQGDEWRQLGGHLWRVPALGQLRQILVGLRLLLSVVCCPLSLVGTKLYLFHKTNKQIHSQLLPNDFKNGYFRRKYPPNDFKNGYFNPGQALLKSFEAIPTRDRRFQNHLGLSRPGTGVFKIIWGYPDPGQPLFKKFL